ncbi:MAG: hypothetical protein B7Z69_08875 [Actinobacteria bacterium 21-73-9]|nr:MAG: hypothetical protein B7Z69_08875 [Actinobacteria bacterium 21-73-9]
MGTVLDRADHLPAPLDPSPVTIRLVLSDVDGTLLTSDKRLTESAVRAVADLEAAGIAFAITSSRPPRGLAALVEPLRVRLPLGAFNGGMIVTPELAVEFEAAIEDRHVGPIVDDLLAGGLSVWVYQGARDWFVLDPDGPHVEREVHAVGYAPLVLDSFADLRGGVIKVVGVSDDPDTMARAEAAVRARAAESVSATRSQSYYLDVTDSRAHKGAVVRYLSARTAPPGPTRTGGGWPALDQRKLNVSARRAAPGPAGSTGRRRRRTESGFDLRP